MEAKHIIMKGGRQIYSYIVCPNGELALVQQFHAFFEPPPSDGSNDANAIF